MNATRGRSRAASTIVGAIAGTMVLLASAGCGTTSEPAIGPSWTPTGAPDVSTTDEVTVNGADLVDGTYWATISPISGDDRVVFHITRVRFGVDCLTWAAEQLLEDGCLNDYGVEAYPDAYAGIADDAQVTVAMPDRPGDNLTIDAATLHRLVFADPTVTQPAGYLWVPFPFLVTTRDGTIVTADQIWVP